MVDPLGWAVAVFLAGWFALTGLLVVNRSPRRFGVRFAGWAILTTCAAVAADWFGAGLSQVSVAGRGGSVGAYLRFGLEDSFDPLAANLTFAAATLAGLVLAADWLVIDCARAVGRMLRGLWRAAVWGNDRVADGSEKVIAGLGTAAKVVGHGATGIAKAAKAAIPSVPSRKAVAVSAATPAPAASSLALAPEPSRTTTTFRFTFTPSTCRRRLHCSGRKPMKLLRTPTTNFPPLALLNDPEPFPVEDHEQKLREVAALLEKTFPDFGLNVKVVGINTGPVITQYEVALETGLRLNKVTSLADDLALNLKVPSVRIVAPIPGKNTVGIEVPNEIRQTVRLKELVGATAATPKVAKDKLPLFLGKDAEGRPLVYDLADDAAPAHRRPHRHRQVGLPERDHPQPADDAPAGRVPDDPDRPEDGRAVASTARSRT